MCIACHIIMFMHREFECGMYIMEEVLLLYVDVLCVGQ